MSAGPGAIGRTDSEPYRQPDSIPWPRAAGTTRHFHHDSTSVLHGARARRIGMRLKFRGPPSLFNELEPQGASDSPQVPCGVLLGRERLGAAEGAARNVECQLVCGSRAPHADSTWALAPSVPAHVARCERTAPQTQRHFRQKKRRAPCLWRPASRFSIETRALPLATAGCISAAPGAGCATSTKPGDVTA